MVRGPTQTRSMSEPTCGVPTTNQPVELHVGAQVLVPVGRMVDRTRQPYDDRIAADAEVPISETGLWTVVARRA